MAALGLSQYRQNNWVQIAWANFTCPLPMRKWDGIPERNWLTPVLAVCVWVRWSRLWRVLSFVTEYKRIIMSVPLAELALKGKETSSHWWCSLFYSENLIVFRCLIAKETPSFVDMKYVVTGIDLQRLILSSLDKVHVTSNSTSCQHPVLDWPVEVGCIVPHLW